MRKIIIVSSLLVIILILIGIITITLSSGNITGEIIEDYQYTYTTAICNGSNFCQDYKIGCNNEEIISTSAITGAVVQKPDNWKDSRNNTEFCE